MTQNSAKTAMGIEDLDAILNTSQAPDYYNQQMTEGINSNHIVWPNTNPLINVNPWDGQLTLPYNGVAVKARCYNRNCKHETSVITELKLGTALQLSTYICETCLKDIAEKIKAELGLEPDGNIDV